MAGALGSTESYFSPVDLELASMNDPSQQPLAGARLPGEQQWR